MFNFFKNTWKLIISHGQEVVLGLFVLFLPLVIFDGAMAANFISEKIEEQRVLFIEASLDQELQGALEKTKEAVAERKIDFCIFSNDDCSARNTLEEFSKKYGFSAMVAVNEDGMALARVPSSRKGDYVFQTTPWGRRVAKGRAVASVGTGRNFPLVINSSVPILENGEVKGALFGGYSLDDEYAAKFKQQYLKPEEQIAFYSKKTGIYGNSFGDAETQRLLKIYFSEGTDWIQKNKSELGGTRFRIGDKFFHVGNVAFAGLDESAGGMLIFLPINPTVPHAISLSAGIILLAWLVVHLFQKHRKNKFYIIGVPTVAVLLMVGSFLVYEHIISLHEYAITKSPYTIYNSTMEFNPEADIFDITRQQRVAIQITTGGEAINAAEVHVKYDPAFIRVDDIVMDNSFCGEELILEKQINNEKGEVSVACGKPNGFTGDRAVLAELAIQPLRVGKFNLQFQKEVRVLANDGFGTDVLRTATNGSYRVIDSREAKKSEMVSLFSFSHPNEARWYNNKNIHIDWPRPGGIKDFNWSFDRSPNTIPDGKQTTADTGIDIKADQDGVYYFHLVPKNAGRAWLVSHLKIMIDTTPPELPIISASATNIKTGELVRFKFNGFDNMSGTQKNFYIKIDGSDLFPTLPQLYVPFFQAGKHNVVLRVFDNAGNFSDAAAEIAVK